MSVNKVRYPGPGCVVEFMQGNAPVLALVLEEQGGRLRLYTQGRRETNLSTARLLPWSGPALGAGLSRQKMDESLEERRALRGTLAAGLSFLDVWDLAQGDVEKTTAEWLAGLVWEKPTVDHEAALGHALLAAKTHFRFTPPDFEIFPQAVVEARLADAEAAGLREAVIQHGAVFFRLLWDIYCRRRGPLDKQEQPALEAAERLKEMLLTRIADPDSSDEGGLWKQLVKALPESPHMPLYLSTAWGLLPEHYNFWLDRAGYERGEAWADPFADACRLLAENTAQSLAVLPERAPGYVSIDPLTTRDRDDAFYVAQNSDGSYTAEIALACPALAWPFGSPLDRAVLRRASSLYLPEGDEHMLPAHIGWQMFGLDEGEARPGFVLALSLGASGELLSAEPCLAAVRMSANLDLEGCEAVLAEDPESDAEGGKSAIPSLSGSSEDANAAGTDANAAGTDAANSALALARKHTPMLRTAYGLARLLQARRIAAGAVITERPDPEVLLEGEGEELRVSIVDEPQPHRAQLLVGELMVLANAVLAAWAVERDIALFYRTQDVGLPREFAGVWTEPHQISRVVRTLPPASLEASPKRHAGLGLAAYTTVTSPIRRYVDLLNQGQIISYLRTGRARLATPELAALLPLLVARQDAVAQVQRFRPRYWKLLFFRQQGEKKWWDGVVTDENEAFVTIALPWAQLLVRGRRHLFDERTHPGCDVQVRLGKVNPLLNEIQVLESRER